MDPKRRRSARASRSVLGFPVLRLVRLRRHLVGRDCRRAAGVLLSDRAVGRRRCCTPSRSASASRSAGRWGRSCRRWACICRCCSICRPARRSCARSAWCWSSWRPCVRCIQNVVTVPDVQHRDRRQGAQLLLAAARPPPKRSSSQPAPRSPTSSARLRASIAARLMVMATLFIERTAPLTALSAPCGRRSPRRSRSSDRSGPSAVRSAARARLLLVARYPAGSIAACDNRDDADCDRAVVTPRRAAAARRARRESHAALWIVWAVIVWNVVFDRVIVVAGRSYIARGAQPAAAARPYRAHRRLDAAGGRRAVVGWRPPPPAAILLVGLVAIAPGADARHQPLAGRPLCAYLPHPLIHDWNHDARRAARRSRC